MSEYYFIVFKEGISEKVYNMVYNKHPLELIRYYHINTKKGITILFYDKITADQYLEYQYILE